MPENETSTASPTDNPAPYIIEGARSSRSRCKTCRRTIDKGKLRIGILIEGPFGTGYLWHHLNCAARRQPDAVTEAYENEAWKEAKEPLAKVPTLESLQKLRDQAAQQRKERKPVPRVELAPSGRARCKQCEELIEKGAPRVVLGREVEFGNTVRTSPVNVHPHCVAAELEQPDAAFEEAGLMDTLRENSGDLDGAILDRVIAEIEADL
jgi:hypothetical protein